ncbi:ELL-associated factor 1-like [Varroa jacobsoni]|uniref:Ell-associated factor Eaf n=1 Tax=Varroa destructor TaxID=109461 RepID=A0A7M7L0Z8_VARDE|nr:ELL-associated factor 1-like [Varroa destructor]XP_022693138.1 ELL-associated factor 1-like [Varroa jacobsoni]
MNQPSIGDKLALTGKVTELKLGKSFDSGVNQMNPAFHTFRYDFKPASVDPTQMARVDVEQRNQVSVTVPHHDSNASTVFRGGQRPYQKECVLIIDHRTGEVTLEKLSCNVQLKKTRAEGSSKVSLSAQLGGAGPASHGRPLTPSTAGQQQSGQLLSGGQSNDGVDQLNCKMKRPSPPMPPQRAHMSSPVNSGTGKQRISPAAGSASSSNVTSLQQSVGSSSKQGNKGGSPGSTNSISARRPPSTLSSNSMPMFFDDTGRFDDVGGQQPPTANQGSGGHGLYGGRSGGGSFQSSMPLPPDSNTEVVEMSEGSSSSSSSSGSSSEASDSESESDTHAAKRLSNSASVVPSVPTLPTTSSSSGGYGNHSGGSHSTSHASHPPPSATTPKGSMPKLSQLSKCQLSEDLQLSESGSDSD